MKTFFDTLYQHTDGLIEIRLLPSRRQAYFDLGDHAGIERYVRQNMDQNVFFGVATRDGKGGKKENTVNFPAVWCDVDYKDTAIKKLGENLKRFPFKPSLITLSGGGAHLYWLLNEPAGQSDIEAVEDVNRRIAYALGGDQSATEAARVLRVPGTLNHKYSPPREVKIHRINHFYYELDDFSDLPEPPANKSLKKSPVTLEPVKHGQRNATLTRIAGKYITRGLASDEVLDLCLGWNCRCPEPQSIEDVITTVNSIIKTDRRRRSIINANKRGNISEVFKAWEMAAIEELRKTIQDFEASAMILDPLVELQSTLDILMIGNEADRVGVYRRWKARGNRF